MRIGDLEIKKIMYGESEVTKIYLGDSPVPIEGGVKALKLEAYTDDAEFGFSKFYSAANIEYSYDGENWETINEVVSIPFPESKVVYMRGKNDKLSNSSSECTIFLNGSYNVSGNIMYLLDYEEELDEVAMNCFYNLFNNCSDVTFSGLSLPAKIGHYASYKYMFYGCKSMIEPPELGLVEVEGVTCERMFGNCVNLVKTPDLKPLTIQSASYQYMFYGCKNLQEITIRATAKAANSTNFWVSNVSPQGVFRCVEGVEYPTGTSGIPSGWTVEYI